MQGKKCFFFFNINAFLYPGARGWTPECTAQVRTLPAEPAHLSSPLPAQVIASLRLIPNTALVLNTSNLQEVKNDYHCH